MMKLFTILSIHYKKAMSKKSIVNVRIDATTKEKARKVLKQQGLTISQAVCMFLIEISDGKKKIKITN